MAIGGGRDLLAPLLRRRRRKNHKSGYSGEKRGLAAKGWLATPFLFLVPKLCCSLLVMVVVGGFPGEGGKGGSKGAF